jgi:RNA polymerase sigma factor (TIGR02999 family)
MSSGEPSRITTLLHELREGSESAKEELVTLVYPELHRIAGGYIRAHFFGAVAREMRHILVDYARARDAQKRPDPRLRISLNDLGATAVADAPDEDVVALDEALTRLEAVDPRASRVVELRYFTGLSEREAAEAMGLSLSTLKRDWNFAKAWLHDALQSGPGA